MITTQQTFLKAHWPNQVSSNLLQFCPEYVLLMKMKSTWLISEH
jgi:hypothetical protein